MVEVFVEGGGVDGVSVRVQELAQAPLLLPTLLFLLQPAELALLFLRASGKVKQKFRFRS